MNINLHPIAFVKNSRLEIEDDNWGNVISEIHFSDNITTESLEGMELFSHFEVIFFMDKVSDKKAIPQIRHPRNNNTFPKIGTYAQRNKNRPNKLGLTTVEFVKKVEKIVFVKGLDAISGTPILDVKPVMKEFEPKGKINQPSWSSEIMKHYWSNT